ncbi:hypothetical protein [Collimonas pratensis]|uniref:hypothetical protein n=1 Tax=Collimonas pratensis TaxID=279113 RepID=UPI0012E959B0|nr:hypothetical protein [Collimonas pratensis]
MINDAQAQDVLYHIPTTRWVLGTVERILHKGYDDRETWSRCWYDEYKALGGTTSSGTKPCPCGAAYGLWFLGRLCSGQRPLIKLTAEKIYRNKALGKNAAYAVIAANLLDTIRFHSDAELWSRVQSEFKRHTGDDPALSDQGEVKLVVHLFRSQNLVTC